MHSFKLIKLLMNKLIFHFFSSHDFIFVFFFTSIDSRWWCGKYQSHSNENCVYDIGKGIRPSNSLSFKTYGPFVRSCSFFECCAFYSTTEKHTEKETELTLRVAAVFVLIHLYYLYLAMVTAFVCCDSMLCSSTVYCVVFSRFCCL